MPSSNTNGERPRPRGDFQVEGVPEELCQRFSKRDTETDKALAKLLADHPELGGANISALRAKLATEKRTRKQKDLSRDELRSLWEAQLSKSEQASLCQLSEQPKHDANEEMRVSVSDAVQWAEDHLFDRNSVVLECQLWQEALGRARGRKFLGFRSQSIHPTARLYGLFPASVSFVLIAMIQTRIEAGAHLSILWQTWPYIVITAAEVLVSTTGLEFAFREAAPEMKSMIMSFWLLTVSAGDLFVVLLTVFLPHNGANAEDASVSTGRFMLYAAMMFGVAIVFSLIAATYHYRDKSAAEGR